MPLPPADSSINVNGVFCPGRIPGMLLTMRHNRNEPKPAIKMQGSYAQSELMGVGIVE